MGVLNQIVFINLKLYLILSIPQFRPHVRPPALGGDYGSEIENAWGNNEFPPQVVSPRPRGLDEELGVEPLFICTEWTWLRWPGPLIMSPGHVPGVFQAVGRRPWGRTDTHWDYVVHNHLAWECPGTPPPPPPPPQEDCGGCDLNKEHLGCSAQPAAAAVWRQICEKSTDGL